MSASGIVEEAISTILQDKDFDLKTPRMKLARESAQTVLDAISGDGKNAEVFARFAATLNGKLKALATLSGCKTLSAQRQHMWSNFHSARISDLRRLWSDLFTSLGVDLKFAQDPLPGEYVNEKVFERHIKSTFQVEDECTEPGELSENDLNALRYVAGYVPWKLRQKFRKGTCKHSNQKAFLICLEKMTEGSEDSDDTYIQYTKRWINAVDRGGLFRVSDEVFVLFHEIERMVRRFVTNLTSQSSRQDKQEIVDEIVSDDDVQFHWSMISVDIDHDAGEQLLQQIIQLYLTIRGFSTAGAFVEQYKQITEKTTRKSTSLRKGLKRKKLDMQSDN